MKVNRLHELLFSGFLIVLAMLGLYFDIKYSGWVLGAGIMLALIHPEKDDA